MVSTCLATRFKTIFTLGQLKRIFIESDAETNVRNIIVDVHGLKCSEAKLFIRNIINVSQCGCVVKVIHGYTHGDCIKRMLNENFQCTRVKKLFSDLQNLGVTYLELSY